MSRRPPRHLILAVALPALAVLAAAGPPTAAATPALSWSSPNSFDPGHSTAVSCASETLCAAVDSEGNELSSTDPTAGAPSWPSSHLSSTPLNAVSCAPEGVCLAVDASGDALYKPVGSSVWAANPGNPVDVGHSLTGVSCPTAGLCVAVDGGGRILTSTDPELGGWTPQSTGHPPLTGVSCASPSLCVAVDAAGEVLWSSNPTGGAGSWQLQSITGEGLTAVSCGSSGVCVAVDSRGGAYATSNPTGGAWSITGIDAERFGAVSC